MTAAFILACSGDDDDSADGGDGAGSTSPGSSGAASPGASGPGGSVQAGDVLYRSRAYRLPDETDQAVPGGVYPGSVTVDNTESFDPFTGGQSGAISVLGYDFLVRENIGPGIEPGSPESRVMLPHLADSWEVSGDGMSYTFKMRQGVKFHPIAPVDGRVMDIDDWRSTFERFLEVHPNRQNWLDVVDSVEFPDTEHMVVRLARPYGQLEPRLIDDNFTPQILPRELNEDPELAATKMIGTAYWQLESYQPSVVQEFKRHDDYFLGKPFIERWRYPIIPEYSNAFAQFLAQNTISFLPNGRDVLNTRSQASDALMIAEEVEKLSVVRHLFGKVDKDTAPWGDVRVRIAIRRTINFDGILDLKTDRAAFEDAGIELETGYSTHLPYDPNYWLDPRQGELGEASENYLYDPAEAKKLVEAAGYSDGFELDFMERSDGNREYNEDLGIIKDELMKSGFITKINATGLQRTPYLDAVPRSANFRGMAMFSGHPGGPDYLLLRNIHSEGQASPYGDPAIDELIFKQQATRDAEERVRLTEEIQKQSAKVFPFVPATHPFGEWTFQWNWLHNWHHGYGDGTTPNNTPHRWVWWLDEDMPKRNG